MPRSKAEAASEIERLFPQLKSSGYRITSDFDTRYNCIAFAAGDTSRWWWADQYGDDYWPAGTKRETTMRCFIDAFATVGYAPCESAELDVGFEKIAIFVSPSGEPLHAARQLATGRWVSKLGNIEDIEHSDLTGVEGAIYGHVAQILMRPRNIGQD